MKPRFSLGGTLYPQTLAFATYRSAIWLSFERPRIFGSRWSTLISMAVFLGLWAAFQPSGLETAGGGPKQPVAARAYRFASPGS